VIKIKLILGVALSVLISAGAYIYQNSQFKDERAALVQQQLNNKVQALTSSIANGIASLEGDFDSYAATITPHDSDIHTVSTGGLPLVNLLIIPVDKIDRTDAVSPPISWGDIRMLRNVQETQRATTETFIFNDATYLRRATLIAENKYIAVATWDASVLSPYLEAHHVDGGVRLIRQVTGGEAAVTLSMGDVVGPNVVKKRLGTDWWVHFNPSVSYLIKADTAERGAFIVWVTSLIPLLIGVAVAVYIYKKLPKEQYDVVSPQKNTMVVDDDLLIPHQVFRDYDIRGDADDLSDEFCYSLGRALGTLVIASGQEGVYLGRDGRLSTPRIYQELLKGLMLTGVKVQDVGVCHSGLLYFAAATGRFNSGIMITASHNAKEFNGFKTVINGKVLNGSSLKEIKNLIRTGRYHVGTGVYEKVDLASTYLGELDICSKETASFKVVVDAGNGAAGPIAVEALEQAGMTVYPLYCDIDGNFPNHSPDPSDLNNLKDLQKQVIADGADFGIALDGDGDRIFAVDERGKVVLPDQILMLLAKDICSRNSGAPVVYDIKCSSQIERYVNTYGGTPVVWKSGHSNVRNKMAEEGALLGGELSGHIFIRDDWYGFDDGVYAALRLIRLLQLRQQSLSKAVEMLPKSISTSEIRVKLHPSDSQNVIRKLSNASQWPDRTKLLLLDGVKATFLNNSWGLVRMSNTESALTFRFEGDTAEDLQACRTIFYNLLTKHVPDANWKALIKA